MIIEEQADAIIFRALHPPPPVKVICCFCPTPHVMREGTEPASHGACPDAITRLEQEWK